MAGGIASELAAAGFTDAVEVGRGGGGIVYRCQQTSLGRSVAIKVLASDLDEADRERFLRESFAMGGLSGHPNIVNILQVGVTDSSRPFIVMPYHAAGSLADRVQRAGRIAWPEALRIGVKLCGALETAHRTGTLHRDIKPANVLVNDYGEPLLSDFGTAHIAGGYKTETGFFTGTLSYTSPEVLGGKPPTVAADVYSLGATIFALIAGNAAHERKTDEELIAHYLRITSTPVPDLRPEGIPADVCAAIEKAMSLEPSDRHASAADFGRELQLAQRHNGLTADSMALSEVSGQAERADDTKAEPLPAATADAISVPGGTPAPARPDPNMFAHTASISASSVPWQAVKAPPPPTPPGAPGPAPEKRRRKGILIASAAAAAVLLLVISGIVIIASRDDKGGEAAPSAPAAEVEAPPKWQPIADARVAREAVAATEADGTIWVFGGMGADGRVSGQHEGYDPAIDSWKSGDDLPVPVQHAMAVTWRENPVVLGGWRTEGADARVATDQVWRVVNGRWTELPRLLQPRAAAAAAVVGDRIIVTGGVGADGNLLSTTEIFDGTSWKLAAPIPTARQLSGAASDGNVVYVLGGTNGTADLATVEAYDPAADTWTSLSELPGRRSDFGVAYADGRLVVAGGTSGGQALKSVVSLDLLTQSWNGLPDMGIARHGMAVAGVGRTVYVIGGSTGAGDGQITSSAEALKLGARKPQPALQWHTLPDAPTERLMTAWTVLDGKIWLAGGLLGHDETLQTVESYDPAMGVWQPQPSLPIPLHHATAATYRGEMVVIGGASETLAEASNKVFAFRDGRWVELPALQHARAAAGAAVVGDKLVVVGGQDDKQIVAPTEVFDGESWTQAADLPTPREHLAAVSDGVYVYAVGGRNLSADENSSALDRYDPASGKWEKLADMPSARGSYGAAIIEGRIVAVGGEEPTRVLPTVEMYDTSSGKWTTVAPLGTPRHGQVVAAVGSTLYCIGGADRPSHEGPVATVEALDFT